MCGPSCHPETSRDRKAWSSTPNPTTTELHKETLDLKTVPRHEKRGGAFDYFVHQLLRWVWVLAFCFGVQAFLCKVDRPTNQNVCGDEPSALTSRTAIQTHPLFATRAKSPLWSAAGGLAWPESPMDEAGAGPPGNRGSFGQKGTAPSGLMSSLPLVSDHLVM